MSKIEYSKIYYYFWSPFYNIGQSLKSDELFTIWIYMMDLMQQSAHNKEMNLYEISVPACTHSDIDITYNPTYLTRTTRLVQDVWKIDC